MRRSSLICLSALVLSSAFANANTNSNPSTETTLEEMQKSAFLAGSCSNNVVSGDNENIYVGFGNYLRFEEGSSARKPIPATFDLVPLGNPNDRKSLATNDGVVAFDREGQSLFVLTFSAIEEWDLSKMVRVASYPTYKIDRSQNYKEHANGMVKFDGKLFISHGRLGVSVFDIASRKLVHQETLIPAQEPLESQAVGIALIGDRAIIALDNFSLVKDGPVPFRGFVVYDLRSMKVEKELPGLDPGATSLVADGSSALVGFDGPVWKYNVNSLMTESEPAPSRVVWRYPLPGHPIGRPFLTKNYLFTCFLEAPAQPGGVFKKIPQVLERKSLKID